ncbi:MAG: FprA family A-type flavoprotein [Candidatus Aureabacteria bacterium]|nr:FprA family A-type flavoprotein [Candidatus Auribacterota bacterium]
MEQKPFMAAKITDRVYWVGAIDWAVRDFHGYATDRGTTYNAYLIMGTEPILVDTVKAPFRDEMLARIASVMDLSRIRHIISNHSEMDHSGCLPEMIEMIKPRKVIASAMGVKTLRDHFPLVGELTAVSDGERMILGDASLTFMETRMLHWPDSMFTYLADERLLFSQDGFGMHLASHERFDDGLPGELLLNEAAKYYANIILPFSPVVSNLPSRMEKAGIRPVIIAPDHGPVWRKGAGEIVGRYAAWAAQRRTPRAIVAYDTMWGSTALMARAIGEGIARGGAGVKLMPLGASHRSDIATELLDAGAFILGSPTLNNNLFPTVADLLCYLKGLKPAHLIGAAFGSWGWSGEAVKQVAEALAAMNVPTIGEGVGVKYVPGPEALQRCAALGRAVADHLKSTYGA